MEQRSQSSLAGLEFDTEQHNFDEVLTRVLDPKSSANLLVDFIESAGGGWDKPVKGAQKGAEDGSKRGKKARVEQPAVVAAKAKSAGQRQPGEEVPSNEAASNAACSLREAASSPTGAACRLRDLAPASSQNRAGSRSTPSIAASIDVLRNLESNNSTQRQREAATLDAKLPSTKLSAPAGLGLVDAARAPWMSHPLHSTSHGASLRQLQNSPTRSRDYDKALRDLQATAARRTDVKKLDLLQTNVTAGLQGGVPHSPSGSDFDPFLVLGRPSPRRLNAKEEQILKQQGLAKNSSNCQIKGTVNISNYSANPHDRNGGHVGLPDNLNCLRLKNVEEYLWTPRTRFLKAQEQQSIDYSNRIFHEVAQQEHKPKQNTRVDLDNRVRSNPGLKQWCPLQKSMDNLSAKHRKDHQRIKGVGKPQKPGGHPDDMWPSGEGSIVGASPRRLPALYMQQRQKQTDVAGSRERKPLESAEYSPARRGLQDLAEDECAGVDTFATVDDLLPPDLEAIFSVSTSCDDSVNI